MEQLNEQNRQLRLTEAQLGAPARIDTMAKQHGVWLRRCQDRWFVLRMSAGCGKRRCWRRSRRCFRPAGNLLESRTNMPDVSVL